MKSIDYLFKNQELYQILFETKKDAIFFTENNQIIDCNESAVSLFGFSFKEDLEGKFPFEFSPDQQPDGISSKEKSQHIITESKNCKSQHFYWKYIQFDGTPFDAMVSLNAFNHENNALLCFSISGISSEQNIRPKLQAENLPDEINLKNNNEENDASDAQLKLSNSLLQATLDATTDGILVVDHLGQISSFNKQFKSIFEISADLLDLKDDSILIESILGKLKNPDQFVSKVQYLYKHPDIESFDVIEMNNGKVLERFSCTQQLNGKPVGRVWSFRDITSRRKIEQQLYLMSHAIKSIKETITITDINDRLLFVNAAFIKSYGYTEEELIGQHISLIRTPDKDPGSLRQLMDSNNSSTWQGEIMNRRKDGSDFLISLSTSMVQNDLGETLGMVGIAVDITKQKQAEIELKNSEERLRNLIQTMPDGVYRSTPAGKFVDVNPAMIKMLGYQNREELLDIDITTQLYFDPEDRKSRELEEELKEMGIFRMKRKDGSEVWVEDHGWYVTDENGKIIFHEGISRDITERRMDEMQLQKYSDELKELNATKDKFFSIIAHDLKSPFNSISGLSEIIKQDAAELDIDTIKQYAEIIHSTSVNTFRLLENLLDWARLQQSQIIFRPVHVNLKGIVNEIFELMIEKAQSKKIDLINAIPNELMIFADQDMLKTILRNLVSNALKFSSANGKIEIESIVSPCEIEIRVKDTGIGIKPGDIDKLFRVGSNISNRGTEDEKGTGLGLMLCKEFVEKHGGRIWVESKPEKGCIVNFTICQNNKTNL